MGITQKLSRGLILTDVYASLNAALVAAIFMALHGPGAGLEAAAIIFAEALAVYALNRQVDEEIDAINNPERTAFLCRNRMLVLVPALALFLAAAAYALAASSAAFAVVAAIFAASMLYSFPLLPAPLVRVLGFARLKEALVLKNVSVGAMYGMFVFIPAFLASAAVDWGVAALFAFITLRFFIVSTVFDLRDVEGDRKLGISTIPLALGAERTAGLLQVLNAASVAVVLGAFLISAAPRQLLAVAAITAIFGSYYINETQKPRADLRFICGYVAEADILPAALAVAVMWAAGWLPA